MLGSIPQNRTLEIIVAGILLPVSQPTISKH